MGSRALRLSLLLMLLGCAEDGTLGTPDGHPSLDRGLDAASLDAELDDAGSGHDGSEDQSVDAEPDARADATPDAQIDQGVEAECPDEAGWHVLPVRLHLAESSVANLDATDDGVWFQEMLADANTRWHDACIRFEWASTEVHLVDAEDDAAYSAWRPGANAQNELGQILAGVAEDVVRDGPGWDVLLINRFGGGASGLYLGRRIRVLVLSELMPDGSENHPNILAHELGHSLGLPHFDGEGVERNLMRAGGGGFGGPETATELLPSQVAQARTQAATGDSAGR